MNGKKKDSRIKVISKENGGVSSARNKGIANSKVITLCLLMQMTGFQIIIVMI